MAEVAIRPIAIIDDGADTGGTQLRIGYDTSNYLDVQVADDGVVTFTGQGANTSFVFARPTTFSQDVTLQGDILSAASMKIDVGAGNTLTLTRAVSLSSTLGVTGNVGIGVAPGAETLRVGGAAQPQIFLVSAGANASALSLLANETETAIRSTFSGSAVPLVFKIGGTTWGRLSPNGTWIFGGGSTAGSALPGGIRVPGASQFDAALTLSGGLVSYGANDSAGAGFRTVRVPNA